MSKPTPGPWRIGTPGPNGCYTVGTEGGLMVAMVAHSANQLDQCEQAIGDARLIAAAPELYIEAFELIGNLDPENMDRRFDGLRAVIAKAEGR